MKYVIVEESGIEVGIMFSELISHDQFAYLKPVSAGFCSVDYYKGAVYTWGNSVSLSLSPRPQDDSVLWRTLETSR